MRAFAKAQTNGISYKNVKPSGAIGTDKGKEAFLTQKPQRSFVRYQRKESKFAINKIGIRKFKISMRYK